MGIRLLRISGVMRISISLFVLFVLFLIFLYYQKGGFQDGSVVSETTIVQSTGVPGQSDRYESGTLKVLSAQSSTSAEWTTKNILQNDGVIAVGKLKSEDTDWVVNELVDWEHAIYTVDDPGAWPRVAKNKGREANVYLQYIIDHYYSLPSTMVFLHSHRDGYPQAWHTEFADHSNVETVRRLRTDYVQRNGYVNLRCNWAPGCPDEIQPFRQPRDEERDAENAFPDAWNYFFNGTDIPEVIATPCCAQFAVSRKQVLQRPLGDYLRYHEWVMETEWSDDTSGRVIEYM